MRILITNNTLASRAGSELYVRDLALGLLKRGHDPIAYSTKLGDVAQEIKAAGVPVVDDLNELPWQPDIIHGHHHLDTMMALLCCPATPAIYVCHGPIPWEEAAPRFPRILRYVAVDHACRDRLVLQHAIPPDRIQVILNFVDLERFKPRAQLPSWPRRALIFSNQANEHTHVPAVRTACERSGIEIDVVGLGTGKGCAKPEAMLGDYDLVFAKGRAALEALAVGSAVVLCDAVGAGPMVSTTNVELLRPLNFGLRALSEPLGSEVIMREISRYDHNDATAVSGLIRAAAGRDQVIDELLTLYEEVIEEHRRIPGHDRIAEQRAVGAYLRDLAPRLGQRDQAMQELNLTEAERNLAETELNLTGTELEAARAQLETIKNSRSWRMISRYIGIKHNHVLPAYDRISRLWKRAAAGESDPKGD